MYNKAGRKPWITLEILTSIHAKRHLEKKTRSNQDQFLISYWTHENLLTDITRATREQYYRILLGLQLGTVRKYGRLTSTFLVKYIVQLIPPLNSMAFTLLNLKQLQMRSIPILIIFL